MARGFDLPGMYDGNAGFTGTDSTNPRPTEADTEDVLVRNYDFQWGYDVEVTALAGDGQRVHDERYYLQPGETRSEFGVFVPGEYDVRVVLDNRRTTTVRVEIAGAADGVLVELGNGAVSVQDGLYE